MIDGWLRKTWPDGEVTAEVGPDGWSSSEDGFARMLNLSFPVGRTAAGVGWIKAFWDAVDTLKAEAVVEPVAGDTPPQLVNGRPERSWLPLPLTRGPGAG